MRFYTVCLACLIIALSIWFADSKMFYLLCGYAVKLLVTLSCITVPVMLWAAKTKPMPIEDNEIRHYIDQDGILWDISDKVLK